MITNSLLLLCSSSLPLIFYILSPILHLFEKVSELTRKNIMFSYTCKEIFSIYVDITGYVVFLNMGEYKVLIFNVKHIKVACNKTV